VCETTTPALSDWGVIAESHIAACHMHDPNSGHSHSGHTDSGQA
jgi:hypothetical protein